MLPKKVALGTTIQMTALMFQMLELRQTPPQQYPHTMQTRYLGNVTTKISNFGIRTIGPSMDVLSTFGFQCCAWRLQLLPSCTLSHGWVRN